MRTAITGKLTQTFTITLASLFIGALTGAFILAPMSTSAGDDDDGDRAGAVEERSPLYVIVDDQGVPTEFTLVDNGSGRVLTLAEDVNGDSQNSAANNDDDD